ncbi:MAG: alternative ribosome rescue aminoacyl-tRNA hydrolase ArfB [Bacteroidota bacterium]
MEARDFSAEFKFRHSRSSGSGGQHVNKVATRVELRFDLPGSTLLTEAEKVLLHKRWANRLNKEGLLRLVNQESRSQLRNKQAAIAQFYELLRRGLKRVKKRRPPKINPAAKAKRLEAKRQQSEKKANRRKFFG